MSWADVAIEATHTLVIEGEGEGFILGQGTDPAGSLKYRVTGFRRTIDFANVPAGTYQPQAVHA